MQSVFGRLSQQSNVFIQHRLEQVVDEFKELQREDMKLPFQESDSNSILLAMRSWELRDFAIRRRECRAGNSNARGVTQGAKPFTMAFAINCTVLVLPCKT